LAFDVSVLACGRVLAMMQSRVRTGGLAFLLGLVLCAAPDAIFGAISGAVSEPATGGAATEPAAGGTPVATEPAARPDCVGSGCEMRPERISIAMPARTPWSVPERIAWVTQLLLALVGYFGVVLAIALLRKIERLTRLSEEATTAANTAAQAALEQARALARAERPWVLVAVEPSRTVEEGFAVTALNRGRSPARVVQFEDALCLAADETHLPVEPAFNPPAPKMEPILLLPGESVEIRTLGRDDVKALCQAEGSLQRVADWHEKVYLYGRVVYEDLLDSSDGPRHETCWCFWHVHGRQKSGLVVAGPPAYRRHS
jgi:hypothetical protein